MFWVLNDESLGYYEHFTELYNGQSLEDTCEENVWGIAPFNVQHGCPKPAYCRAKVEVIDAWNKKDPEQKRKSYGFPAKIEVPSWFRAKNKYHGYSILLRFPQSVQRNGLRDIKIIKTNKIDSLVRVCFEKISPEN